MQFENSRKPERRVVKVLSHEFIKVFVIAGLVFDRHLPKG
jgi:hypothetical protein